MLTCSIPYLRQRMARPSHPKKDIEMAIRHAEEQGWRVEVAAVTLGAKYTALTMTMSAAVVSFVSPAC